MAEKEKTPPPYDAKGEGGRVALHIKTKASKQKSLQLGGSQQKMASKAEYLKRYLEGGGGGGDDAGGDKKKRKRKKDKVGGSIPEGVKVKKIGSGIMIVDEVRRRTSNFGCPKAKMQ